MRLVLLNGREIDLGRERARLDVLPRACGTVAVPNWMPVPECAVERLDGVGETRSGARRGPLRVALVPHSD